MRWNIRCMQIYQHRGLFPFGHEYLKQRLFGSAHDDLSRSLTHEHVGGVMIPVDLYFRLEFDQRYIRLDHDILRLDHEFGLNMSRSETSFSVADPATISFSIILILAMKEIVAQIDKIATPVPNNHPPYPLSYPVHCLSSPSMKQRAKLSDQV